MTNSPSEEFVIFQLSFFICHFSLSQLLSDYLNQSPDTTAYKYNATPASISGEPIIRNAMNASGCAQAMVTSCTTSPLATNSPAARIRLSMDRAAI